MKREDIKENNLVTLLKYRGRGGKMKVLHIKSPDMYIFIDKIVSFFRLNNRYFCTVVTDDTYEITQEQYIKLCEIGSVEK